MSEYLVDGFKNLIPFASGLTFVALHNPTQDYVFNMSDYMGGLMFVFFNESTQGHKYTMHNDTEHLGSVVYINTGAAGFTFHDVAPGEDWSYPFYSNMKEWGLVLVYDD